MLQRFIYPYYTTQITFDYFDSAIGLVSFVIPAGVYYAMKGPVSDAFPALFSIAETALNAAIAGAGGSNVIEIYPITSFYTSNPLLNNSSLAIERISGSAAFEVGLNTAGLLAFGIPASQQAASVPDTEIFGWNIPRGVWCPPVPLRRRRTDFTRQAFSAGDGGVVYTNMWDAAEERIFEYINVHPAHVRRLPIPYAQDLVDNSTWGGKYYNASGLPGRESNNVFEDMFLEAPRTSRPVIVVEKASFTTLTYLSDPHLLGVPASPASWAQSAQSRQDFNAGERYSVSIALTRTGGTL